MQLRLEFPQEREDTFENFVTDKTNIKASRLCFAFARQDKGQPTSLLLFGPKGSGKTHLLGAMGRLAKADGREALYLDGAFLAQKVAESKAYEDLKARLEKYENAAFLVVDNLDALIDNQTAQEQLFHIYNAIMENQGSIAVAGRRAPNDMRFISELATRLLWGQAIELKPVGDEKRAEVLIRMAAGMGMTLPASGAKWIVTRTTRDIISQTQALEKIDQLSLQSQRKVSIHLIKEALGEQ